MSMGYEYIINRVSLTVQFVSLLPLKSMLKILVPVYLTIGAFVGGLSSFISVRKHLHV